MNRSEETVKRIKIKMIKKILNLKCASRLTVNLKMDDLDAELKSTWKILLNKRKKNCK